MLRFAITALFLLSMGNVAPLYADSAGAATSHEQSQDAASRSPAGLRLESLIVSSMSGDHRFTVEIADTQPTRTRGLMFRETLAADAGMLFDFEAERPVAFWMRNTLISLDMNFIEASGRIVNIAMHTVPLSEEHVPSDGPVRYVLEVPAGTSARLGFQPGDYVESPTIAAGRAQ